MSYCMGPATCVNDLCQGVDGCIDFRLEMHERGFRASDLRIELRRLAEKYGTQEVVNASLAVKEEWSKRIREAG